MINNKEKKMIQRYCIYPKIAVVALIFSFVQCALIVPLEMIDDLVFQNKGFQPTGMFTALGFVIIYVIIFCFCALAPKFGMNGKKWKSLIGRLNVKQSETDYSKEVSAALASQAVGRFLKESDNDTAKNIGSAMQVAGAVSTVSTSIDMLSEAGSNAENMAHAYRIPIPDIKKQLIAFAVIPILIVVGTYIPQYIKGKQAMDQRIAASAKQVEIVKKALEPVCVRVHADNPNESRSRSSYTVMGYLRDSGATDCYVHVQVNNSGTIINISLEEQQLLEETHCKVETESNGPDNHIIYLSGGSGRDKALFAQCVNEFFDVIDNQRYILVKKKGHKGLNGFYAIPNCFSKKKEDAERFAKCMHPYIGNYDCVYTRNEKGRELLLEGRVKALANREERCISHKKVKGALE